MDDTSQWDFLDSLHNNKYIPYLSQEYDPFKPHDYHRVVELIKRFKRDHARKHHENTDADQQEIHKIEPLSSQAEVLKSENADDAYRRRGGIDIIEEEDVKISRVLLFYRIQNSIEEKEIKSQILKMVEPFGKILEIMLDVVPEYVGLPPEDNLRIYIKFKDSSSSKKGDQIILNIIAFSSLQNESFVMEYFDESSFDERDLY